MSTVEYLQRKESLFEYNSAEQTVTLLEKGAEASGKRQTSYCCYLLLFAAGAVVAVNEEACPETPRPLSQLVKWMKDSRTSESIRVAMLPVQKDQQSRSSRSSFS